MEMPAVQPYEIAAFFCCFLHCIREGFQCWCLGEKAGFKLLARLGTFADDAAYLVIARPVKERIVMFREVRYASPASLHAAAYHYADQTISSSCCQEPCASTTYRLWRTPLRDSRCAFQIMQSPFKCFSGVL